MYFCKFLLLKNADAFDVQKLNCFPIRDRTLQFGKLLLEFYDEIFQYLIFSIHIRENS